MLPALFPRLHQDRPRQPPRRARRRRAPASSPSWGSRCTAATARTRASSAGSRSSTSRLPPGRSRSVGWELAAARAGLHELEVQHRAGLKRTFVYASVPASEYSEPGSPSGRRYLMGRGDFRLIDITNPRLPVEASSWGVHRNEGGPLGPGLGCDPDAEYGHSAEPSADGKLAFVSYWDSGFVALDVSDPARPIMTGHTAYPANADGDAHSSNDDEGRERHELRPLDPAPHRRLGRPTTRPGSRSPGGPDSSLSNVSASSCATFRTAEPTFPASPPAGCSSTCGSSCSRARPAADLLGCASGRPEPPTHPSRST